ncbi:T9SS type A sorting domain-containing protein [Sediminicola sp. 1XM1-17]|uniref:T9SS type A sorting domain-containing protein n=1 Tax=Sediminicola sp. 1XM1-17 TaxID=3127702 RepID=UPI003077BECB
MKRFYLTILLTFSFLLSAQEMVDINTPKSAEISGFKLYPNPSFDDVVYVTTKLNDTKDIVVYDVFGAVVLKDRIATNSLNIARLIPGVYVLQITERNQTMTRKLVVK